MDTNQNKAADRKNDPDYRAWNADTRQFLMNLYEKVAAEREIWVAETMKHIALISLAGLAGVFALLGSQKVNQSDVYWPAVCFAASSVLCVAAMYVGVLIREGHLRRTGKLLVRLSKLDVLEDDDFQTPRLIEIGNVIAVVVGWMAAAVALWGGILLFNALDKGRETPSTPHNTPTSATSSQPAHDLSRTSQTPTATLLQFKPATHRNP